MTTDQLTYTPDEVLAERPELDVDDRPNRHIEDDSRANLILRLLIHTEAELGRITASTADEVKRLERMRDDEVEPLRATIEWARGALGDYLRRLTRDDPGRPARYPLAYGALVRKTGRTKLEVEDEAAFLAWAKVHRPSAVKAPPAPEPSALTSELRSTAGFRRVVEDGAREGVVVSGDGEVVPGVRVVQPETTYVVEVAEPKAPSGEIE